MKEKIQIVALTLAFASSFIASSAYAQHITKRVKCADNSSEEAALLLYRNESSETRILSVQIVRDGCRPKLFNGSFRLATRSGTETFTREGKFTNLIDVSVFGDHGALLYFAPLDPAARVSGTFDYILLAD